MLKKIVSGIMAAALVTGIYTPVNTAEVNAEENDVKILGDLNGDRIVNAYDLVILENYLEKEKSVQSEPLANYDWNYEKRDSWKKDEKYAFIGNADIDDDGSTDEKDAGYLTDYLLNKPTPFTSAIGSKKLSKGSFMPARNVKAISGDFVNAHFDFGVDLFKRSYEVDPNNALISPLSAAFALTMAANGAKNNTLAQMEQVLGGGMPIDEFDAYLASCKASLESSEKVDIDLANAIWYKEDSVFEIQEDFLDKNMECLGAEAYEALFNDDAIDDINNWASKNTKGLIKTILNKDEKPLENKEMCMLNTVYFNAEWYMPCSISSPMEFTDINGNMTSPEGIIFKDEVYFKSDDYIAFKKDYKDTRYSFVGLLPNKELNFNNFIAGLDAREILCTLDSPIVGEDSYDLEVNVKMPMFKHDYFINMKDILCNMGMEEAFDINAADFSGMTGFCDLYLSDAFQKTIIEVNKTGTKAAAVTAVFASPTCAAKERVDIVVDRPFVYMIYDNETDIPLFIGAVTEVKQ